MPMTNNPKVKYFNKITNLYNLPMMKKLCNFRNKFIKINNYKRKFLTCNNIKFFLLICKNLIFRKKPKKIKFRLFSL